MSEFKCEVVRVKIETHPNADAIEIARIGDYQSIVRKGQFADGDLAVYIPEQAVVPEWLLKKIGLWDEFKGKGGLSGSLGNRVKAIKLRGVLSQGIMFPGGQIDGHLAVAKSSEGEPYDGNEFAEGDDAAEFLGVVKYEPPIPSHMRGRVVGVDFGATHKYDFDNLKKMPNLFDDGEDVVITEKIHGTLIQIGVVPSEDANEKYYGGRVVISSKGMGANGMILDHNDETNLYAQAAKKHGLLDKMLAFGGDLADIRDRPVFLIGEVFGKTASGKGVQDLTYSDEPLEFRAFDICIGNRGTETYVPFDQFIAACHIANIPHVPVLYVGAYSKDVVLHHTDGKTSISPPSGRMAHIREGVVVKSLTEARHPHFGRKIAKSVSEAYLLRKDATEFN